MMDLEDKYLVKVSGLQSLSSSVQSTPEKNGHSDDASRTPELLQEFLKSGPKKELVRSCFDKDKKHSASSKRKMCEVQKASNNTIKNLESRKASHSPSNPPRKQSRKGENPKRLPPPPEPFPGFSFSNNSWICKNAACRAHLSMEDTFCRRCSCCICHKYDDNKDPSLWLVCSSESNQEDSCGLSCHIECALRGKKVGVVDLGQLMQLDGSYCCASCGKVSGILGCWKKQLVVAKDARRVDVLCYRIFLGYRLLHGTSKFKELLEIVTDAKDKLETEVGPLGGFTANMARGIVSRLPVAEDVLKLCARAIEKVDECLASVSDVNLNCRDSLPAACRVLFEEVKSSSVVIILIEMPSSSWDHIEGYKLWYSKSREETNAKEPICVFPRSQRRIKISNLQPCTEYTFCVVSYTEAGDWGHSEARCFTKSVEIIHKNSDSASALNHKKGSSNAKREVKTTEDGGASSEFQVRKVSNILQLGSAQKEGLLDELCTADVEKCCGSSKAAEPDTMEEQLPAVAPRGLDLNLVSVPDLNEELTPPFESSRDEDNNCALAHAIEADDDAASHDILKNDLSRSHGSGDSQTWANNVTATEMVVYDFQQPELCRKRPTSAIEEAHESDSTLVNGSPFPIVDGSGGLDENFEYCVKIIRWLECEGHINKDFRLKLLTWFSLRSTDQERRVVNTFIQTLIDDPSCLAGQLVDSFSDIISSKRQRNGLCSKLWH